MMYSLFVMAALSGLSYYVIKDYFKRKKLVKKDLGIKTTDYVTMQLQDSSKGYANVEGIVVEIKRDGMTRVIAVGTEIEIPSSMLTK